MILMFFADFEVEGGEALDWACSRAAAEQMPVGKWVAQVLKLYQKELLSQEQSQRAIRNIEARNARIRNGGCVRRRQPPGRSPG